MSELIMFNRSPYARSNRCVECGQSKEDHIPGKQKDYCKGYRTMNLPEGKTCGDCFHIPRCNTIFGHMATDERCDWYPVRFVQRPA
jgi:hypothetical protein